MKGFGPSGAVAPKSTTGDGEMDTIPNKARAVIVGGGVIGCSVAYHLAKLGWKDVVLLERKQLTSGTTWHAAGLIAQLRPSANMTKLAKYTRNSTGGSARRLAWTRVSGAPGQSTWRSPKTGWRNSRGRRAWRGPSASTSRS